MDYKIINGLRAYCIDSPIELIKLSEQQQKIFIALNTEKIIKAPKEIRDLINSHIGYPDGVGVVWALQKKGCFNSVKIPGVELWYEFIKYYKNTKSYYFIGGTDEVINKTVSKLNNEFNTLNILKYRNGYFDSIEEELIVKEVETLKPDIVFVAMGSPKQEKLMKKMYESHKAIYLGLGGSFDVFSGKVNRAPAWWINNNLEWAYRLFKQPSRIKKQIVILSFLIKLKLNLI